MTRSFGGQLQTLGCRLQAAWGIRRTCRARLMRFSLAIDPLLSMTITTSFGPEAAAAYHCAEVCPSVSKQGERQGKAR